MSKIMEDGNPQKDVETQIEKDIKEMESGIQKRTSSITTKHASNENTLHPEPHSIWKFCQYPKTGGRLGNNILLWGNELKHDNFPFIGLIGPHYGTLSVTYIFSIAIFLFEFFVWMNEKTRIYLICLAIPFFVFFFSALLYTTCSNPGLIYRGEKESFEEEKASRCRLCDISRPKGACHCEDCDCCCLQLDHHCPWMGKCIGKRNYRSFFISVCCLGFMSTLASFTFIYFMMRIGL